MVKKWLCIAGFVLHFLLAILLIVCIAQYCKISDKKKILIADVSFVVLSVFIGMVFLKLNIDKLFLKFEINGVSRFDSIVLLTNLIIALLVVSFEILMVAIYFFRGVKMVPSEFLRFTIIPSLSLAHLAVSTGCYSAFQYFNNFT